MNSRVFPIWIAVAVSLLAIAIAFTFNTTLLDQGGSLTRWTARFGMPLFLMSFAASALRHFVKQPWSARLMQQRRYWGLGFVIVHTVHMIGFTLVVLNDEFDQTFADMAGGGAIYLLMYLMAITSNNWSVRKLSRYWRWLHLLGSHGLWIGFTVAYTSRLYGITLGAEFSIWDSVSAAMLYAVMILRIAAMVGKRRITAKQVGLQ